MSACRPAMALLLALAAAPAAAQYTGPAPRGFALQAYEPPPAGDRSFTVPGADAPGHLVPAAALALSWATEPLVLQVNGQTIPGGRLVHRQAWGFVQGSIGLSDRWLLDLSVPVVFYQSGSQPLATLPQVAAAGLGDLKLGARRTLGRVGPVDLAAAVDLWIPTGSERAFSSDGSLRLQPKLLAGGERGDLEYGGELGFLYRETSDRVVTRTGPALTYGLAGAWRHGEWRVGPELHGRFQFQGTATSPNELLLGGHWQRGVIDAGLAIATGLDRSPGAAPFRLLAQVSWRPEAGAAARAAAERARLTGEREAEARAELDRLAAERALVAAAEAQAAEARARAAADQARLEAERAAADRDGDGVPDRLDACPDQPGPAAADPTRNGCPPPPPATAPQAALVKLTAEKIEILQSVQFETDQDVIRPESERLLAEVAGVLSAHPELRLVRVEGHTDAKGSAGHNLALSEKRARAVKRWLVERGGIAVERLDAKGYGPTHPVASNDTAEGRAANRRVEFVIVGPR